MTLVRALVLVVALGAGWPGLSDAQSGKQVKVAFDFRQASTQNRDAVDGRGRVIITDRGGARSSGRLGVDSTQRRVQTSTGIFTIVQDGGESTMLVASQIPYSQVTFYRDYLTGAGYIVSGVQFKDVGTSLKVRAAILPGNQVRVRLTPTISWLPGRIAALTFRDRKSTRLNSSHGSISYAVVCWKKKTC